LVIHDEDCSHGRSFEKSEVRDQRLELISNF
jgi:hypothetical protein